MHEFVSFRSKGQTMVLVALMAIALIAFVALAVDGGNAYSIRRDAQSAADGAAIAGTWVMVDYVGFSPVSDILYQVNQYAQQNGVPDTNGDPDDIINDNVKAYYVYFDGSCLLWEDECWELHTGPSSLPSGARGIHVQTHVTATTFFARAIGVSTVAADARATATYQRDGGILPVAVNEYWLGSQGHCPYDNCGEPYSFLRDPSEDPPFESTDGITWQRNECADPYNEDTCQGPYEGYAENYGKALALLGGDAKPNYGSQNPRSGVMLDCRYDALDASGEWWYLPVSDVWAGPGGECPMNDGDAAALMEEVILAGGYSKSPLPRALHEPPPEYIEDGWAYCWATPENEDNCFNYPETDRDEPYDTLQFLNGTKTSKWAETMCSNNYNNGQFVPGTRIVVMAYNSVAGDQWGSPHKADSAVVVGYFGAVIVGCGNNFTYPCSGTPGDWASYTHCLPGDPEKGNTVYGLAANDAPLVIDPSKLLDDFLPKKITLIKGAMDQ